MGYWNCYLQYRLVQARPFEPSRFIKWCASSWWSFCPNTHPTLNNCLQFGTLCNRVTQIWNWFIIQHIFDFHREKWLTLSKFNYCSMTHCSDRGFIIEPLYKIACMSKLSVSYLLNFLITQLQSDAENLESKTVSPNHGTRTVKVRDTHFLTWSLSGHEKYLYQCFVHLSSDEIINTAFVN